MTKVATSLDFSNGTFNSAALANGQTAVVTQWPTATEPLPDVDAVAFVCDGETAGLIYELMDSPEPGRIFRGSIAAAVAYVRDNPCPPLLIVDLSEADNPIGNIDTLSDECDPGTIVIALGNTNDVRLYRQLADRGVSDYLIKPLVPQDLVQSVKNALANLPENRSDAGSGELYIVAGARGGIGTSMVATNIAFQLARDTDRKVLLVDLDLQFGSIALSLDLEPSRGLLEALIAPDRVDSVFLSGIASKAAKRTFVMAAEEPLNESFSFSAEGLETFLSELRSSFDVVVVDMPRVLLPQSWAAIQRATRLVLVSDLSLPALRDTTRLISAAKDHLEAEKLLLVANRVGADRKLELEARDFAKTAQRDLDIQLPEDLKAMYAAAQAGRPIVEVAKGARFSTGIRKLCEKLQGAATAPSRTSLWRGKKR